ncbi:unnamed protein product [Urochloa humidicola]
MAAATISFLYLLALIFSTVLIISADTIVSNPLKNGGNITDGDTVVSAGGSFTLGFFTPTGAVPTKRYLGIWFTAAGADSAYWVANRDTPLSNNTGVLVVSAGGRLRLLDGSGQTAWNSSSNTTGTPTSSVAELLESGNLVVREQSSGNILWQSFDHPSNTLLYGMRLGNNPQTGAEWSLTSWRAADDPSPGNWRFVLDTKGLPDCVIWQGNVKKSRTGPWNGLRFSGTPEIASFSRNFYIEVVVRPDEIAYVVTARAGTPFSFIILTEEGLLKRLAWDPDKRGWTLWMQAPRDLCDDYGKCGAFGMCNMDSVSTLLCSCVEGFSPVNQSQWSSMRETSAGCRRNVPLECGNGKTTDGFRLVREVKLPDTDSAVVDMSATLEQCRATCLANCSCVAYSAADIRGGGDGNGCVMWMDGIIDVRYVEKGQDLYVRLAKSELVDNKRRHITKIVLPVTASLLAVTAVGICLVWICRRGSRSTSLMILQDLRGDNYVHKKATLSFLGGSNDLGREDRDLTFVCFGDIVFATDNFSEDNMLGQGGFGKVYKGMMEDHKEVAIKRLDKGSRQGAEEFRNEVVLIAKLQHRNLVRLLGCCIHGDEKLLIYEYLPNKSLDSFIFDAAKKKVLDWSIRFKIIKGISRGLLYLHQDSRIFGGSQQEENTNRVVGTYGYMSPEYAMDGAFSVKSDTYSFGVILLEIVSGLKITLTRFTDFPNLLAYAWSLWQDGKAIDLLDSSLIETCSPSEVLRCIHIGLLCVQDNPNSRPLMSSVVFMLENEFTPLSVPKQPVYFAQRYLEAQETEEKTSSSVNDMSVTMLKGR